MAAETSTNGAGHKPRVAWNKGRTSPLKGRKWTKAMKKKAKATRALSRAEKAGLLTAKPRRDDAIIYLRHGIAEMQARLNDGRIKREEKWHILIKLALKTLEEG